MLKYVSKITMDILPSVAATIIGAYIVNHYITAKPAADAPAAAAVSSANPKKVTPKVDFKADSKPPETSSDLANLPEAAGRAKGVSEKAASEKAASEKAASEKAALEKSAAEKPADKPAETASIPADTRRHPSGPREKTAAKTVPAPAVVPAAATPEVATPNAASPVEAAIAPDDHLNANEIARVTLERLRGTNEGPSRTQEATHAPDTPRLVSTTPPASAAAVRPLPPPIMVSTPGNDRFDAATGSSPNPPYAAAAPPDDPRRPTPPADIPVAPPLDLRAEVGEPARPHTNVAEDMLSSMKSVFHAVLPKPSQD
jgi:hypothetical protein